MICPIVKSAIGNKDIRRSSLLLSPTLLVLLRTNHYEGQLSSWLPNLVLLSNLLSICWPITSPLVVTRLWLFSIVDFVTVIMSATIHCLMLFFSLCNSTFSQNIEASLCFSDQLPILMLLEAHVLLLYLLLSWLVAFVHRLRVHSSIEALRGEHLVQLLLSLTIDVDFCWPVELISTH